MCQAPSGQRSPCVLAKLTDSPGGAEAPSLSVNQMKWVLLKMPTGLTETARASPTGQVTVSGAGLASEDGAAPWPYVPLVPLQ